VDCARDQDGNIVEAEGAGQGRSYVCPRPGCGGRVFLRQGDWRRAHFAHRPGEGTHACDEYHPAGVGGREAGHPHGPHSTVEDSPRELGLIVDQTDGEWRLGLRLPEVPQGELGDASLSALRQGKVEVSVKAAVVASMSALDLRPGIGTARVPVDPAVQGYVARATGSWPPGIDTRRWDLVARGLDARGTLFRLRGGEWTRLRSGVDVHEGEELVVLGMAPPHVPISPHSATCSPVNGGSSWTYWEVLIPYKPAPSAVDWLRRLGHAVVSRPWTARLATPPHAFGNEGEPICWVGEVPVVSVAASEPGVDVPVLLRTETNSLSASATAAEGGDVFLAVEAQHAGTTNLTVGTTRGPVVSFAFVQMPSRASLLEQLGNTPRVRIRVGEHTAEAWLPSDGKVHVGKEPPEVRVDLGGEGARAVVTIWERGKQRSVRGLSARGAERIVAEAIGKASRIELDAGNFGRIELVPTRGAPEHRARANSRDRLAWFDHVASTATPARGRGTTVLLERPGAPASVSAQRVGPSAIVRSRLALRRQHGAGGNR
jgi:hypothetical protein